MAIPDCHAIGGPRVQASHLRLSTHVRASSLPLTSSQARTVADGVGVVARKMSKTADALHAIRSGGAPWPSPTDIPSVDDGCKRDTFDCPRTCVPLTAAHVVSKHASWLSGWAVVPRC